MNSRSVMALMFGLALLAFSCSDKLTDYDSIEGSWRCNELNPVSGQRVYLVDIDQSNSDTTLYLISNFYNQDINEFVFAYLSGDRLVIPQQNIVSVIVRSGAGVVSDDFMTIEMEYSLIDGTSDIKVRATLTRP